MKSRIGFSAVLLFLVAACGDRPEVWDTSTDETRVLGLRTQVAFVDNGAHRVVLASPQGTELDRTYVSIGKNVANAVTSSDGERLFVLTRGETPRRTTSDERAALSVIASGAERRFPLDTSFTAITLDPKGRYVALLPSSVATTSGAFVENPNQFTVVDLDAPAGQEISARTLRSFGGRIQRATFTEPLTVGGEQKRFLVLETDEDISLLDLGHLHDGAAGRPEVTVRLTSGTTGRVVTPAGIVFDDGDPARNDDATIAVRPQNDSNVVILTVAPGSTEDAANDFSVRVNLVDAGGIVSDLAYVKTDAGRRLAALVPSTKRGVLIEQETSATTEIAFPDGYSRIALIGGDTTVDTAVLYGATSGIAFWALGQTGTTPYRSIETLAMPGGASTLLDVPEAHGDIKIISPQSRSGFFVLNLRTKTAAPLTTSSAASLHVAPTTERVWAYTPGTTNIAQLSLTSLSPVVVPLPKSADAVFEVITATGPSLLAVSANGAGTAMIVDANAPQDSGITLYEGLLLEGLSE